jgi:serine/threonine protein kinase
MEFCQGGELFERIVAKTTYNEKEARDVIRMLLSALAFCHNEAKVVHRDLKVGPPSLLPSLPPSLNSLVIISERLETWSIP